MAEPTIAECLDHAARLLRLAESEPECSRMERFEKLADSWVSMAGLLHEREKV